jgi:hypothetical protein
VASNAGARSRQGLVRGPDHEAARPAPPGRGPAAGPLSLQRTLGNRATAQLLRQPKDQGTRKQQPPPPPRPDYVFIMGADPPHKRGVPDNPFYEAATAYWKAHLPQATVVTDKRDLDAVLTYLQGGTGPIGSVYIVSHANEDGTLAFSLEAIDHGTSLSVPKLREALHPTSGKSLLSNVSKRVDSQTRIHIKGCDIGRTRPMVELIDEAFGGAGVVDAPTHEQEYGIDSQLADKARADFRKEIEAAHPVPAAIDPKLKGAAKTTAKREHDKAVRERNAAVAAELKSRHDEGETRATLASHFEAFSGPMFQRPGTTLFTTPELRKEIDRLYPHLSDKRREALAAALTTMDHGSGLDQHGQRLIRRNGFVFTFMEIKDVGEAMALFGKDFRKERFTPTSVTTKRTPKPGGFEVNTVVKGHTPDDPDATREFDGTDVFPGDAEMLKDAKAKVPNPDSFAWKVEEHHKAGQTTRTAVAERVLTYLHHESLDAGPHTPFTRPLTDKDFFATSTFAPPAPAAATATAPKQAVRRLARDPKPDNLKANVPTSAYVKAAVDFRRDKANAARPLSDYATFLHGKANDALASIGVPTTKPLWDGAAPFIAQFDANHWTVTMNPKRFTTRSGVTTVGDLTDDEAAAAAGTIYHESRHAEQHFRIARVGVGKLKKDEQPGKPLTLLPADVLKEATAHKLVAGGKDDAASIAEAEDWASTATGRHAVYAGLVDTWLNEVAAARTITIEPMKSDVAKGRYDTFVGAWRGKQRRGFVNDRIKALAKPKAGTVDAAVLTNLKAITKAMDIVDTAYKKVEAGFAKGGPGARLTLLQDFKPVLYDLAKALEAAYRSHPHEADAFAAGEEVVREFLAAVKP